MVSGSRLVVSHCHDLRTNKPIFTPIISAAGVKFKQL